MLRHSDTYFTQACQDGRYMSSWVNADDFAAGEGGKSSVAPRPVQTPFEVPADRNRQRTDAPSQKRRADDGLMQALCRASRIVC